MSKRHMATETHMYTSRHTLSQPSSTHLIKHSMNNSVWASGLQIIITIRIIMFILLFIVLRHQYLCSAAWRVYSYSHNAWSATSDIRMAGFLSSRAAYFSQCCRLYVCQTDVMKWIGLFNDVRHKCMLVYMHRWSNYINLKDHVVQPQHCNGDLGNCDYSHSL